MGNPGREYLRKLKEVQRKNGGEKLTQEEIDMLFKSLKEKDSKSLFPLSNRERDIDKKYGIKRNPRLGCLIAILGTLLFWATIYKVLINTIIQ